MPHLYTHYLLVTCPPLTILTWPLESWWLFTNTCSFLAVTWTCWFPPRHPYLFIVLHDSFLIMHYWSLYCPLWHLHVLVTSAALLLSYLLEYISQSAGDLLPQTWLLSLYYCTLVKANRPQIPTPLLPARTHSKLFFTKGLVPSKVNYSSSETI